MAKEAPNATGWLSAVPSWLKFAFFVGVLGVIFGAWSVGEFAHAVAQTLIFIKNVFVILWETGKEAIAEFKTGGGTDFSGTTPPG